MIEGLVEASKEQRIWLRYFGIVSDNFSSYENGNGKVYDQPE
jgi:hypothetical protein